jgi:hypothetical protein
MSKSTTGPRKPTHDEIAARAQRIYESEGRPQGRALQHWLMAERELTAQQAAASPPAGKPAGTPKARGNEPASASWRDQPVRQNLHTN